MTRPVLKPRSFLPISREQAAVALAACAVACLSSAIVHWSCQYPVSQRDWGHPLFGEFGAKSTGMPAISPESVQRPLQRAQGSCDKEMLSETSDVRQNRLVVRSATDDLPDVSQVHFTQVAELASDDGPTDTDAPMQRAAAAWFCGAIEEAAHEASDLEPVSAGLRVKEAIREDH
jgi:hypothetical protein